VTLTLTFRNLPYPESQFSEQGGVSLSYGAKATADSRIPELMNFGKSSSVDGKIPESQFD
jgi:hypothetical protein